MKLKKKYQNRLISSFLLQQLLFCVVYFILLLSEDILDSDLTSEDFMRTILMFIFGVVLMEFNLLILIPRFLKKDRISLYFISVALSIFVYSFVLCLLVFYLIGNKLSQEGESSMNIFTHLLVEYSILIIISTLYYYNFEYIKANKKIFQLQAIQKEQKEAELMALKSQLNPHFLFNTLNNIYSYSVTNNPNTSNLILKLSELTSYVLYDSDKEKVALSSEVEFIENFIELKKIRLDETVRVDFDVQYDRDVYIAPLLFIPLVENVFNHGLHTQSKNDYAKIVLRLQGDNLTFITENTCSPPLDTDIKQTGVGIKNLRKRLQLIYPEHELNIIDKPEMFKVKMKIRL
jgi:sensor histidine kinase YesM